MNYLLFLKWALTTLWSRLLVAPSQEASHQCQLWRQLQRRPKANKNKMQKRLGGINIPWKEKHKLAASLIISQRGWNKVLSQSQNPKIFHHRTMSFRFHSLGWCGKVYLCLRRWIVFPTAFEAGLVPTTIAVTKTAGRYFLTVLVLVFVSVFVFVFDYINWMDLSLV